MPKVFISHRWAEGEHEFARELRQKLENYQDITVLLDEYEMLPGDTIKDWMDDAIQKGCDVFLFVLSPDALQSENCQYELKFAHQTGIPIIPVYLRECEIPENLKGILFSDFREDFKLSFDSVERLVQGIRRQAEKGRQRKSSTTTNNKEIVEGWHSPSLACNYLKDSGLPTRGYKNQHDDIYGALSNYQEIGSGFPLANNIAYYVTGQRDKVEELKLVLNVNVSDNSEEAHHILLRYCEILYQKALGEALPQNIKDSILQGKTEQWNSQDAMIELSQDDWGRGYSLKFAIRSVSSEVSTQHQVGTIELFLLEEIKAHHEPQSWLPGGEDTSTKRPETQDKPDEK